jgi:hypothetical protein
MIIYKKLRTTKTVKHDKRNDDIDSFSKVDPGVQTDDISNEEIIIAHAQIHQNSPQAYVSACSSSSGMKSQPNKFPSKIRVIEYDVAAKGPDNLFTWSEMDLKK